MKKQSQPQPTNVRGGHAMKKQSQPQPTNVRGGHAMKKQSQPQPTPATWGDVWDAVADASEVTMKETTDWVRENPKTAATAAVAVGIGVGYLLFG